MSLVPAVLALLLVPVVQAPPQADEGALVARWFAARPDARPELRARLRAQGSSVGPALLERIEAELRAGRALPAGALELLLEVLPAELSERAAALRPLLGAGGEARLLAWLARRDLPGFRDHEEARALALVGFIDGRPGPSRDAARALAGFDLPAVVERLDALLRRGLDEGWERPVLEAIAAALAGSREAGPRIEPLLALAAARAPWLEPSLLRGLVHRPDRVVEGALDPWVRARHPALAQAVADVVQSVDARLFERRDHALRVAMFARFRRLDPRRPEWAFREAHVALFDLADARAAAPALAALGRGAVDEVQRSETACMRAVAAYLAGQDPLPALVEARAHAEEAFAGDPGLFEFAREADVRAYEALVEAWRSQVPPRLEPRDREAMSQRALRSGGRPFLELRNAGRRRLGVDMLATAMLAILDRADEAGRWLDRAERDFAALANPQVWDEDWLGPNTMLDGSAGVRSGALDFLTRCLEGNEVVNKAVGAEEYQRRLARADKGFAFLVRGLAERLPERVLGVDAEALARRPGEDEVERVYADLTAAYGRFLERIGEAGRALELATLLAGRLESAAEAENRMAWAALLFQRASILMDERRGEEAEADLLRYVRWFEDKVADVRQNPDRYYSPDGARSYYSSFLVNGYVSLAVCNNVVLGRLDRARGFIRKAYTLDDSPFQRVLYACYLARDGQRDEAMALVSSVDPTPSVYYNLACTYALSGARDEALRFLALDLEVNHPSPKARNRQRRWAANDHDFEALRDDPGFKALVAER